MSVHVTAWVYDHAPTDLSPGEMLVALVLADHANPEGGNAYPSIPRIAAMTRLTQRSVIRSLQRLVALGVIAVTHEATNRRPTVYGFRAFSRGDKLSPPNHARGDICDTLGVTFDPARGDMVSPEPLVNRQENRPTPPNPHVTPNGTSEWVAEAEAAGNFQIIAEQYFTVCKQLDKPWLRTTVTQLQHDRPYLTKRAINNALEAALDQAEDAFNRPGNRINNPAALVRKWVYNHAEERPP